MNTPRLAADEVTALKYVVTVLGRRKAKSAIRQAWLDGNYRNVGIYAFDDVLQRLRNRDGGIKALALANLSKLPASV
jgi:hypothetical protein